MEEMAKAEKKKMGDEQSSTSNEHRVPFAPEKKLEATTARDDKEKGINLINLKKGIPVNIPNEQVRTFVWYYFNNYTATSNFIGVVE
jgi:hypothetical protein